MKWRIEHDSDDEEYPTVWIGDTYFIAEHDPNWIVDAHNADIDALAAERDELQRRLDAVVAIVGLEQQGEFEDWPAGEHLRALRDVRAIAEGREG